MSDLREEISSAINRASAENGSDTPDFILAEFLTKSLEAFDSTVKLRDKWYGIEPQPGWGGQSKPERSPGVAE